jgi:hypothetical protein
MSPDKKGWGYYSIGICGYEVRINDDESVLWVWVGSNREQIAHKAKIYYTARGRAYFIVPRHRRIHLDQCIRYDYI